MKIKIHRKRQIDLECDPLICIPQHLIDYCGSIRRYEHYLLSEIRKGRTKLATKALFELYESQKQLDWEIAFTK